MFGLGIAEIGVISGLVILLFGAKKLPQFGTAVGETIRNLRWSVKQLESDEEIDG